MKPATIAIIAVLVALLNAPFVVAETSVETIEPGNVVYYEYEVTHGVGYLNLDYEVTVQEGGPMSAFVVLGNDELQRFLNGQRYESFQDPSCKRTTACKADMKLTDGGVTYYLVIDNLGNDDLVAEIRANVDEDAFENSSGWKWLLIIAGGLFIVKLLFRRAK